jgi:transcription elongation factor Elf1
MDQEKQKHKCEFKLIKFGDKIISVERKTSCWTEAMGAEGNVEIVVDTKTGKKTATCKVCGNTMTWGGTE